MRRGHTKYYNEGGIVNGETEINRMCTCGHVLGNHKVYNGNECGCVECKCTLFNEGEPAMEQGAEAHLARVKQEFCARVDEKYRKGQREHGGRLWRKPHMLDKAIEEVIDLAVYLLTLKEQEQNPAQVSAALCDGGEIAEVSDL